MSLLLLRKDAAGLLRRLDLQLGFHMSPYGTLGAILCHTNTQRNPIGDGSTGFSALRDSGGVAVPQFR